MVIWHETASVTTLVWYTHYVHTKDTINEYAAGGLEIKSVFDQKLQHV